MKNTKYLCCLMFALIACTARGDSYKDIRMTYLWDVTLSMKGYNGSPNIYDKVVTAMIKDIESITNERTEIVVVPFQNSKYCDVWKEFATPQGKANLKSKIKAYKNDNVTNTNISAPLQYAIDEIFTTDKIDIMKLMTDGVDNVDPNKLKHILDNWCQIAKSKDVYGYYILLTDAAKENGDLIIKLKEICNFETVDLSDGDMSGIGDIRQLNVSATKGIGLVISVRDEYGEPKSVKFSSYGGDVQPGYQVHFKTEDNPYIEIDEVVTMDENYSFEVHPKFKRSKSDIMAMSWESYNDITLQMTPVSTDGPHKNTRLLDESTRVQLINKPEKTVSFYVL